MDTRRAEKLNNLLREQISNILDRDVEFPEGALITVTRVHRSQDGLYATVFFTVLNGSVDAALETVKKNLYAVQQSLNKIMRIRPVPKIRFVADEDEMRRESVERSLAEMKRKGEI